MLVTHTLGPPRTSDCVAGILWEKCFLPTNMPAEVANDCYAVALSAFIGCFGV
jgi:hypothetical protein